MPKFGDWDSNPASADGYTHIFNKVREEKGTQAKAPAGLGKDVGACGNDPRQHDDGYVSSVSSMPTLPSAIDLSKSILAFRAVIDLTDFP